MLQIHPDRVGATHASPCLTTCLPVDVRQGVSPADPVQEPEGVAQEGNCEVQAQRHAARRRSPLPHIPRAAATGTVPALTNAEIQAILDEEDAALPNRSAGR